MKALLHLKLEHVDKVVVGLKGDVSAVYTEIHGLVKKGRYWPRQTYQNTTDLVLYLHLGATLQLEYSTSREGSNLGTHLVPYPA